jgi:hypothetical protein
MESILNMKFNQLSSEQLQKVVGGIDKLPGKIIDTYGCVCGSDKDGNPISFSVQVRQNSWYDVLTKDYPREYRTKDEPECLPGVSIC